jgi:Uma2 family endonuclease
MMTQPVEQPEVAVRYGVRRWNPAWAIPEVPVPESDTHDVAIDYLKALLLAWVARTGRDVKVARNLGIRWVREEPRMGFDPDLCLIEPAPPRGVTLSSLRLWEPEHVPPFLAIEIVSPGHPYKDYVDTPERCGACGVGELWVYDPMQAGPRARGGPTLLELWRRGPGAAFDRVYAGDGPAWSPALGAWLWPARSRLPAGAKLRLSDDAAGERLWQSLEEQSRSTADRLRGERDALRAECDGLAQRLAELERGSANRDEK